MRHIQGSDRAQTLLLPASVEDYVGEDNPVRAIEAFVDGFDLLKAGFVRAEAKETGRPGTIRATCSSSTSTATSTACEARAVWKRSVTATWR